MTSTYMSSAVLDIDGNSKVYPKINSIYKRYPREHSQRGRHIEGDFADPLFETFLHEPWVFTEKVDGTNIRIVIRDGKYSIHGRTNNAQLPKPLHKTLLFNEDIAKFARDLGKDAILFGEGYGPKIQKGGDYADEQNFVMFDAFIDGFWLNRERVEQLGGENGIRVVHTEEICTLYDMLDQVYKGARTSAQSLAHDKHRLAEGYVGTLDLPVLTRKGTPLKVKLKHVDFDLP